MEPGTTRATVFRAGDAGVSCYRIPALVLTGRGTLLAFTEARKTNCGDWAHSALLARRCEDPLNALDAWGEPIVVHESDRLVEPRTWDEVLEAGRLADEMGWDQEADDFEPRVRVCTNNPVPIADMDGKTIHLVFNVHYDSAFYTRSVDDGVTWAEPVDITGVLDRFRDEYEWTVVAAGPGQGLQLERGPHRGRLIVPFWLCMNKENPGAHNPSLVATIYSDDGGKTWHEGSIIPTGVKDPNETKAVQLEDGSVLVNTRNREALLVPGAPRQRAVATSPDGATGWTRLSFHPDLPEPVCMGAMARARWASRDEAGNTVKPGVLVFTIPCPTVQPEPLKGGKRENLTIFVSLDDGKSWQARKLLKEGPAAYSDIAVDMDRGIIYCLHEAGDSRPYERLDVARFSLDWLLGDDQEPA